MAFPAWMTNAAVVVAAISLLGLLIRQIGPWRKQVSDTENQLRTELFARVTALEAEVVALRRALEKERDKHAAEMEDVRHELNNETQSLDAFILLAEANPERVLEQLPKIKEMRARHRERVALRRGARSAGAQSREGSERT